MTYKHVFSRRTFLRGAGGVTVGLPFLDEMRTQSVFAAEPEPIVRGLNVFFGLGYQRELQADRMTTRGGLLPLEPLLDKFKAKLAFITKVDQTAGWGSGNAHYDGSAVAFTGTNADRISTSKSVTGGASMDQALRLHVHPNAMPDGVFGAIDAGTWWRFSDSNNRYIHSRNANGQPAGDPKPPQTPKELFAKVFGATPGGTPTPMAQDPAVAEAARKKLAMRHSVLDGVTELYKHYTSDAGNLGAASRVTIKDHFERIRSLEQEVAGMVAMKDGMGMPPAKAACQVPAAPTEDFYPHRNAGDDGGIDVTVDRLGSEVRLMAKLFAMGVACDRIRFGSFVFQSGGERIRLKGAYNYNGRPIATFDDRETSHEYWHRNDFTWCRRHLHFSLAQITYLLEQLDAIKDANDKSVVDTAMLTITTESGSGVHGGKQQEMRDVLHIIGSGNGRFKVGLDDFIDLDAPGIDLYNTMLGAFGVPKDKRLWDGHGDVSAKIMK